MVNHYHLLQILKKQAFYLKNKYENINYIILKFRDKKLIIGVSENL